jgi:hypothetical protein
MNPLSLLNHLLNFFAPALWLALLLPLLGRLLLKKKSGTLSLLAQAAVQLSVAALALGWGLWYFGNDGKMATYSAMVLLCASSQWLMQRGWQS